MTSGGPTLRLSGSEDMQPLLERVSCTAFSSLSNDSSKEGMAGSAALVLAFCQD